MKKQMLVVLCSLALVAGCTESLPTGEKAESHPQEPEVALAEVQPLVDAKMNYMVAQRASSLAAAPMATGSGAAIRNFLDPWPQKSPEWNRESYDARQENGFVNVAGDPLSTFSIDVDTASYANVRRFVNGGQLPPVGAVRIEEMINYFSYDYPEPQGRAPFTLTAEVGASPFHSGYLLARIGLKAKALPKEQLPASNLVFLLDVSGSMHADNKLPLLQRALPLLVQQLDRKDRVTLIVYAGADQVVLEPTAGDRRQEILTAIEQLRAGGSTHASSGIRTAYELARKSFIPGGNNRVILASDGDFNVGVTSRDELTRLIEKEREDGIYLTVLGLGMGNYHDDTMEVLADKGNGNYAYIDSLLEAKKVLVKEMSGTLFALANDVKIQVEFNPSKVGAYRLIGYENRMLADEDFKDDSKDAGEIGVGHRVTALYELIPAGSKAVPQLDPLKYQKVEVKEYAISDELMTVKLRYKPQGKKVSQQISRAVKVSPRQVSADFQFASAVAGYGMLLTHSKYLGDFSWKDCLQLARTGRGPDGEGYRAEFYRLVEASELLANEQQKNNTSEPQPILR